MGRNWVGGEREGEGRREGGNVRCSCWPTILRTHPALPARAGRAFPRRVRRLGRRRRPGRCRRRRWPCLRWLGQGRWRSMYRSCIASLGLDCDCVKRSCDYDARSSAAVQLRRKGFNVRLCDSFVGLKQRYEKCRLLCELYANGDAGCAVELCYCGQPPRGRRALVGGRVPKLWLGRDTEYRFQRQAQSKFLRYCKFKYCFLSTRTICHTRLSHSSPPSAPRAPPQSIRYITSF